MNFKFHFDFRKTVNIISLAALVAIVFSLTGLFLIPIPNDEMSSFVNAICYGFRTFFNVLLVVSLIVIVARVVGWFIEKFATK
ncbi:hypothetical protein LJC17_01400 [Acholeplasma sp. OttesenSCG-928-E16]|nr:hypothetical protein [Acholeplasma sp. OttesenSCG-928-E16]